MVRSVSARALGKLLLILLILAGLAACETLGYYGQAARGQLAILWNRERIEDLLEREAVPQPLRARLETVLMIREFAINDLQLPAGESYLSYVDLEREHVVWNVFAAPEFSVEPLTWCYPIAGCVSYRGYFSERGAREFAARLEAEGYDVYTGGVAAYSTLGWFNDPVLSTVLNRPDYQLAALIFHELAHRLVYVPGDTTFNESFATLVEREGLRRWLQQRGDAGTLVRAEADAQRRQQFIELVIDYRSRFKALYESDLEEGEMRLRKNALQQALREAYQTLKREWDGPGPYDAWFANPLNNAQLSTVSSYNELVPVFQRLLNESEGDLSAFYSRVRQLAELDADERARTFQPE